MRIHELQRLPARYFRGGKQDLQGYGAGTRAKLQPLPGGSRFQYYINKDYDGLSIYILDPQMPVPQGHSKELWYRQNPVGWLSVDKYDAFPLQPAYRVYSITVDEDYRGQGIATALYGIVLSVMGAVLVAGTSQTPGGRRNWANMYRIPGAEIRAYVEIYRKDIGKSMKKLLARHGAQLMGQDRHGYVYYDLPVRLRPGSKELELLTRDLRLYTSDSDNDNDQDIGLYARFKGAGE